jgi:predicted DsbA family dithiol-disulfide isomerase
MVTIDVVSDVICPWCYVGKRRLEAAIDGLDTAVSIAWRPFQLNPTMPTEGMDRRAYVEAKFGNRERGAEIYRRVAEVGETVGISFRFDRLARTPNTVAAHRLIGLAGAAGRQDAMVEALFQAYFLNGADIGDPACLVEVAAGAGFATDGLADFLSSDVGADAVRAEDAHARQIGIEGVPCFIFANAFAVSGAQEPATLQAAIAEAARRGRAA